MSRCLAIILAAGGSSRMGQSKALLRLNGTALVVGHVEALSVCPAIVVVGHRAEAVRRVIPRTRTVLNADWATTYPSDSLRVALAAHPKALGVMVTPVDVPPAQEHVVDALIGLPHSAVPVGDDGTEGHPVWVTGPELERLRRGPVDGGLRAVLVTASRVAVAGILPTDFDDPEAFRAWQDRLDVE